MIKSEVIEIVENQRRSVRSYQSFLSKPVETLFTVKTRFEENMWSNHVMQWIRDYNTHLVNCSKKPSNFIVFLGQSGV